MSSGTALRNKMALLDGGERSANASTLLRSEYFVLERASFLNLITPYPELLTRLLSGLTERLRRTDDRCLAQMAGVVKEKPFVDKIWNAADVIDKRSADVQALLQKLSSSTQD